MKPGIIYSMILHLVLFLLIIFGFPYFFPSREPDIQVMTVDLVPIKDISNIQTKSKQQVEKKEPDQAKTVVKATNEAEKEDVKKEETPIKDAEKIKEEPKKKEKEKKKEEPKKEDLKKPEPKKEEQKKEKPKKKKIEQNIDINSLLKSLEDSADQKTDKATKNSTSSPKTEQADNDSKGEFNPELDLSLSEYDNIKRQIEDNWEVPSGSKDIEKMFVKINITIEKDGTVSDVKFLGGKDGDNPQVFQVVIESAIRAIKKSSPIQNLNPSKLSSWHHIDFNFDVGRLVNR